MPKVQLVLQGLVLVFFALATANSSSGPRVASADYPPADSLAGGASHTCAVTQTGGLKCWGYAAFGQLGNGGNPTNPPSYTPVDVVGLTSGVASVATSATDHTTCIVTTGGGVKCWGENTGNFGGSVYTPVDVTGLASGVQTVDVGEGHRCALTTSGGVKCWGTNNQSGQLGNGTEMSTMLPSGAQGEPVDPIGLTSGVTAISIGHRHSCALTSTGGVKCWGINFNGEIGDGTTIDRLSPVDVTGLTSGVAAISAGTSHTCALMATGGVKCWGAGGSGRLGDGTVSRRLTPVDVMGLPGPVASIGAGQNHTCAVMADGTARCWGDNSFGKVGDGSGLSQRLTPMAVVGISSVQSIEAGGSHTCATLTSGGVRCWGRNEFGQLGIGQSVEYTFPAPVAGLANGYGSVRAGGSHSCAVTAIGGLRCWGKNDNGQLGDGSTTDRFSPVHVAGLTHGVAAVTTGELHSCALLTGGGLKCWGNNGQGRLGDGTALERLTPVDVTGLTSSVVAVSAGTAHTCALTVAGGVKCWGLNTLGRLGDGTTTSRTTPVDVLGLTSGVVAVAAGDIHTCALLSSGAMKCWGSNLNGRLGDGTTTNSSTPVDVAGLGGPAAAIATGDAHTCALLATGGVKCWGNGSGRLGNGTVTQSIVPVDVTGLGSGVSAVTAGGAHACATLTAGGAKCWGANSDGQLGDGTLTQRTTPVDVTGLTGPVLSISAGGVHTCAVTGTGAVVCWGDNDSGRSGTGIAPSMPVPVQTFLTPPPTLRAGDLSANEGNGGTTAFAVAVTLDVPWSVPVTVGYGTVDGAATVASGDYLAAAAVLTFAPGEVSKTVLVQVQADTADEPDEVFSLYLSTPINAKLGDDQGVVTILNDESTNVVPSIGADSSVVTVGEGAVAGNTGAYADGDTSQNVGITASVGSVTKTGTSSGTWSWSAPTADGPAPLLSVTITADDGNGGVASTTFNVVVANMNPVATLSCPGAANEGSPVACTGGASDVSSADQAAGFAFAWSVTKNGAPFAGGTGADPGFTPDDNATYAVTLTATDKDGGAGLATASIAVANVNPSIVSMIGPSSPIALGGPAAVTASVQDSGAADMLTCTFDWGDGFSSVEVATAGLCPGLRIYPTTGVYTVTVTVADDDGGTVGQAYEFVVVYDPAGGFVTGAGWINSPAGAYVDNPSLVGKAHFGFQSRYQPGATVPTGNTSFKFQAAGFTFSSTAYDWLVVAGAKAQFKGVGTLDDLPGYRFLLTATDGDETGGGGLDRFRIKITNPGDGLVYDNVMGAADGLDADPQAIGAGNISVHR